MAVGVIRNDCNDSHCSARGYYTGKKKRKKGKKNAFNKEMSNAQTAYAREGPAMQIELYIKKSRNRRGLEAECEITMSCYSEKSKPNARACM